MSDRGTSMPRRQRQMPADPQLFESRWSLAWNELRRPLPWRRRLRWAIYSLVKP